MEGFWKAAAVMLLTVILGAAIGKTEKDLSSVVTVLGCCIIVTVALGYLSDVMVFLRQLTDSSDDQYIFLGPLLKISGVALVTEITAMIGADTGNQSLGKAMQVLGNAAILCLSLPLFESFLSIIRDIMGYL